MYQISDGISYCHSKSIGHRDLKTENIFVSAKDDLLIGNLY